MRFNKQTGDTYRHTGAGQLAHLRTTTPEAAPNGSRHCSAWVTSKMTGELLEAFFITPKPSISTTVVVTEVRAAVAEDYFVVTPSINLSTMLPI